MIWGVTCVVCSKAHGGSTGLVHSYFHFHFSSAQPLLLSPFLSLLSPCPPPPPQQQPQGFISPQHKNLLVSDSPEELVSLLQEWSPPASNVLADAASRAAAVGQDISQASDAAAS